MTFTDYLRTAGPALPKEEIQLALRDGLKNPQVRAVLDLLAGQLKDYQELTVLHPDAVNGPEHRHFHAGAVAGLTDLFDDIIARVDPR